jgi:hypothetical protein
MSNLAQHIPLVKDQMEFHQRMVGKYAEDMFRQRLHKDTQAKFAALLADLETSDKILDQKPIRRSNSDAFKLSLTPQDIEGLPEEVLRELSISESDKTEFAILSIIEDAGGVISLDRLIVNLWKATGETHRRPALISRLYRMAQKDLVFSVPTKKGVYSNRVIGEDEASRLFGREE